MRKEDKGQFVFRFNKQKAVYICGYTARSRAIYSFLNMNNYSCKGIIDLKKNEYYSKNRTPEIINWSNIDHDDVFFISSWSIATQCDIANLLSLKGYENLIFFPNVPLESKNELTTSLRTVYEGIVNFSIDECDYELPKYSYLYSHLMKKEKYVTGNRITVKIPIEILFANDIPKDTTESFWKEFIDNNYDAVSKSAKKIFLGINTYEIMSYLERGVGSPLEYLQVTSNNAGDRTKGEQFVFRQNNHFFLKKMLYSDSDYFYYAAPNVVWNDEGFFCVKDGMHRVCFLGVNGITDIYVSITDVDYKKYIKFYKEKSFERVDYYLRMALMQIIHYLCHHEIGPTNICIKGIEIPEEYVSLFALVGYPIINDGRYVFVIENENGDFSNVVYRFPVKDQMKCIRVQKNVF